MIYTVTFNPAIDYVLHTERIQTGCVNRSEYEEIFFGGKGINVSAVLAELGVKSKALGFTAGFTGEAIEQGVKGMGIDADFVRLKSGNSRINVKLKADEETEINGQGPHIDSESIENTAGKLLRISLRFFLILFDQTLCAFCFLRFAVKQHRVHPVSMIIIRGISSSRSGVLFIN